MDQEMMRMAQSAGQNQNPSNNNIRSASTIPN